MVAAHSGRARRRRTAAGRRWPAPTACTGSATWPSWRTPSSCSLRAAAAQPRATRPRRRAPAGPRHRDRARLRAWSERTPRTSAEDLGVPFAHDRRGDHGAARPSCSTPASLPTNPLDVWGTGADTRGAVRRLADRAGRRTPASTAVALAVDLVPELDGDPSYPLAVLDAAAAARTSRVGRDQQPRQRDRPRAAGQPARSRASRCSRAPGPGCCALRHLLDTAAIRPAAPGRPRPPADRARPADPARLADARPPAGPQAAGRRPGQRRAAARDCSASTASPWPRPSRPATPATALAAAASRSATRWCSRPTSPAIAHKSDVGGVLPRHRRPGRADRRATPTWPPASARAVLVCQTVPAGAGAGARRRPRSRPGPADRGRRRRHAGRVARRPGRRAAAASTERAGRRAARRTAGQQAAGRRRGRPRAPTSTAITPAITGLSRARPRARRRPRRPRHQPADLRPRRRRRRRRPRHPCVLRALRALCGRGSLSGAAAWAAGTGGGADERAAARPGHHGLVQRAAA